MGSNSEQDEERSTSIGVTVLSVLCFLLGIAFMVSLALGYLWCGTIAIGGSQAMAVLGVLGAPIITMSCYLVAIMSFAMSGVLWKHRHDGDAAMPNAKY